MPSRNRKQRIISKRSKNSDTIGAAPQDANYLIDMSEHITDNSQSLRQILNDDAPQFLSQFECQRFDTYGTPGAANDVYPTNNKARLDELARQISSDGGWTNFSENSSMTYGIIPDDQLTHNNMMPFFSTKHGYGSNDREIDALKDYKTELFTGNLSHRNKRSETGAFFKPVANLTHAYGTPIYNDDVKSRCSTSQFRQCELPFDKVSVTPGVALGAHDIGTHGYHSMYRPMAKTIDELRVKPKITYEGRTIDGMHGQKRPYQADVISYRPQTFKTMKTDDMLPTSHVVDGPKVRENIIVRDTDRSKQHCEYTGGAYEYDIGKNVPEEMREKHKQSTRATFTLPTPQQKFSRTESQYNQNLESYNLPYTMRDQNVDNKYLSVATGNTTTYASNSDAVRTTNRELSTCIPTNTHVISNTMRGTVHNMDIANTTMRETTLDNPINPNISTVNDMHRVYINDTARATTRETTQGPIVAANVTDGYGVYANLNDISRTTQRETTSQIPYHNYITPVNQQQRAPDPMDVTKTTMRETINTWQSLGHQITPTQESIRVYNSDPIAATIRDTTNVPLNTFTIAVDQYRRAPDSSDIMRTTSRETTGNNKYIVASLPVGQYQMPVSNNNPTKTTIRETTVQIPYDTTITPVDQHQRAPDYQDITKTTMRETTVATPWNNFILPVNQYLAPVISNDATPRTTTRETMNIQYPNVAINTGINLPSSHYQDITRTTTRETNIENPQHHNITPSSKGINVVPTDNLRTTIRETINIPYKITNITPVNHGQSKLMPMDEIRTTMRETTQMARNQGNIVDGSYAGPVGVMHDLGPTLRETLVETPRSTIVTAVDQMRGAPNIQDNIRTTIRETLLAPSTTIINTKEGMQGVANTFNREPLKTTLREQTIHIPYNTTITTDSKAPTTRLQDIARTTTREQLVSIPTNTQVFASAESQGPTSTYCRELANTLKETMIDNERLGTVNQDINGKGYGYMTQNMYAPNTNKQFTCQEVYIAPVQGHREMKSYMDAENAQINTNKESLQVYRSPTTCGVTTGPDATHINMQLRNDDNKCRDPNPGYIANNYTSSIHKISQLKLPNTNINCRFMDPMLIQQLESNPYHISMNL